jgi:hypothetical protein
VHLHVPNRYWLVRAAKPGRAATRMSDLSAADVGQALGSGAFAGLVATLVTVLIEKCGGLVGGVLGSSPSTILPASVSFFFSAAAFAKGDPAVLSARLRITMFTIPMAMFCNAILLLSWRYLPRLVPQSLTFASKVATITALSVLCWLIPACLVWALTSFWAPDDGSIVVAGSATFAVLVLLGIAFSFHLPHSPPGTKPVTWKVLIARGVGAGISITSAVLLSKASPALAGLISAFPAIFLTTMLSVYLAQGEGTTIGAVSPMVLGSSAVSVYAVVFGLTAPIIGPWAAMALSYGSAILGGSIPSSIWLRWRRRVASRLPEPALTGPPAEDDALSSQSAVLELASDPEAGSTRDAAMVDE